jgi:DNA-directed RNA polymerase specialized sigma24 family protein
MEPNRMFVVDAIARFERTRFEGPVTGREENPEYRKAQLQHAGLHAESVTVALQRASSLAPNKRQAIMRALATDMTHAEIAQAYGVSKSTVSAMKRQLDACADAGEV